MATALVNGSPASGPGPTRARGPGDDSAFSEQILAWMRQGDRMAEARPPEVVDLSDLSDPIPQPRTPQTPQKRALVSRRRLRRWLTVGAIAIAGWAVVVWATRQSVTVDRPVFAAMTAAKAAEQHRASTPTSAAQPPGVHASSPAPAAAPAQAALGKPPAKPAAAPATAAHARHRTVVAAKRVKAHTATRPALGDQPRADRDQGDVRGQRPGRGRS